MKKIIIILIVSLFYVNNIKAQFQETTEIQPNNLYNLSTPSLTLIDDDNIYRNIGKTNEDDNLYSAYSNKCKPPKDPIVPLGDDLIILSLFLVIFTLNKFRNIKKNR